MCFTRHAGAYTGRFRRDARALSVSIPTSHCFKPMPPATLRAPAADGPDLPKQDPPLRGTDPAPRKLRKLPLPLDPHKQAPQLFGRNPARPGPTERVEDEVPFLDRGHDRAANEAQGFLGGVRAVRLLPHGHGGDGPYGGDLGRWIGAVYEDVVEGVARPCPCSPTAGCRGRGPTQAGATPRIAFRAMIEAGGNVDLGVAL